MIGTLIWIGETSAEFRGAVEYCLLNVSQIAFRRNLADALARPASGVRWIVIAQSNRNWAPQPRLTERHPDARTVTLLGPLCQGMGASRSFACCDWHQWEQVLPAWLGIARPAAARCHSVAVVAASLADAEPLLDLAQSAGSAAVWCRSPAAQPVRNIEAVWWDDSIAKPATESVWRARIDAFGPSGKTVQHAWVANPTHLRYRIAARSAGVAQLVSKPQRVDRLLGMLAAAAPTAHGPASIPMSPRAA